MPRKVSYTFVASERFASIADKVRKKTQRLTATIKAAGVQAKKTRKKFKGMGEQVSNVGRKMSLVSAGIVAVGTFALVQAANIETMAVAFSTLTGSAELGAAVLEKVTKFTAETPFQLQGVSKAATMLLAFGVTTDDLVPRLRALGDVAVASGRPLSDFARIFGKIKAKGKVTAEELNQLAEAGIAVDVELAQHFGVTQAKVREAVSKGSVTFDVFLASLNRMVGEGGRFFGMTQKQAETSAGLWSTLKDNVNLAAAEVGFILNEQLKLKSVMRGMIGGLQKFTNGLKEWVAAHPGLAKVAIAISAVFVVLGPLLLAAGALIPMIGFLSAGVAALGLTFGGIAAVVLPIVGAFALLIAAGAMLVQSWDEIKLSFKFLFEDIRDAISGIQNKVTEFVSSGAIGKVLEFVGAIEVDRKSQATVDVNLNAPEGVIQSVKTATRDMGERMNLGVTMAEGAV